MSWLSLTRWDVVEDEDERERSGWDVFLIIKDEIWLTWSYLTFAFLTSFECCCSKLFSLTSLMFIKPHRVTYRLNAHAYISSEAEIFQCLFSIMDSLAAMALGRCWSCTSSSRASTAELRLWEVDAAATPCPTWWLWVDWLRCSGLSKMQSAMVKFQQLLVGRTKCFGVEAGCMQRDARRDDVKWHYTQIWRRLSHWWLHRSWLKPNVLCSMGMMNQKRDRRKSWAYRRQSRRNNLMTSTRQ